MQLAKKYNVVILFNSDLPAIRNRAVYQRTLFLCKKTYLTLLTQKHCNIDSSIFNECESIIYIPSISFASNFIFVNIINRAIFTFFGLLYFIRNYHNKKIDLIYTYHRYGFTLGGIATYFFRLPWIPDMQHTPLYYWDNGKSRKHPLERAIWMIQGIFYLKSAKYFLPKAFRVVCMSHGDDEGFSMIMKSQFGVKSEKIISVPNGADLTHFKDTEPKHLIDKEFFMIYPGQLPAYKCHTLLRLGTLLPKNVRLLLVGSLPRLSKSIVLNRSEDSKVDYLGFVPHEELLKLYRKCHFGLFVYNDGITDHRHSHPGKIYEYLASGLAVISMDFPSCRRVIRHGGKRLPNE